MVEDELSLARQPHGTKRKAQSAVEANVIGDACNIDGLYFFFCNEVSQSRTVLNQPEASKDRR